VSRIDARAIRAEHRLAEVYAAATGKHVRVGRKGIATVSCPPQIHGGSDNHPSMRLFTLDRPGQTIEQYRCFACGAEGNVIDFVRAVYGLEFRAAVTALEDGAVYHRGPEFGTVESTVGTTGQPLVEKAASESPEQPDLERSSKERVVAALRAAWAYYTVGALHEAGVEYLKSRGTDVTALESELGQPVIGRTPFRMRNENREDKYVARMRAKGFTDDELVDAGLVRRYSATDDQPETVTSFFRQRYILPVKDDEGRIVGLIGRRSSDRAIDFIGGDAELKRTPKYLNIPDTITYKKSEALYRPFNVELDPRGQVVVGEGTLDALAVAAAAAQRTVSRFYAPVAESGAALSQAQLERIAGMSHRAPVLAADSDDTGSGANLRWAADLLAMGRESAVTVWPTKPDGSKHDPSSYLAEHGPEALLSAVASYQCLESTGDKLRPIHASELVARHLYNTLPASSPTERLAEVVALGAGLSFRGFARHEQTVVRGIGYRVAADLASAEYPTIAAKISAITEPRSLLFDTTADAAYQVAAAHVLGPEVVRTNLRVVSASEAWPSLAGIVERTSRIGAVEFDTAKSQLAYARSVAKVLAMEGLGPDGWLERQVTGKMPLLSTGEFRQDEDTPGHGFGLAV
jgi:DNA primase